MRLSPCLLFGAVLLATSHLGLRAEPVTSVESPFVFQSTADQQKHSNTGTIRYDFGTTTQLDDKYAEHGIEHTFIFVNHSAKAITITEIKPGDICVKKNYVTDGLHNQDRIGTFDYGLFPDILDLPLRVPPEGSVKIFVSIDPIDVFTGPVLQFVDVMVQGQTAPAATLQMLGVLQSGISFSKSILDFHRVAAGKSASQLISITLDRRLHRYTGENLRLKVVSNNPDIHISKFSHVTTNGPETIIKSDEMEIAGPKENAVLDFPGDSTYVFKVTLSPHAPLGIVKGSLSISAPRFPSLLIVMNARVPFDGEVIGDITDDPPLVVFGNVHVGKAVTKSVLIFCPRRPTRLKVVSHNPNIAARLLPTLTKSPHSNGHGVWRLEIALSSHTPLGVVEDKVTINTSSGQRLIVPVFASVSNY